MSTFRPPSKVSKRGDLRQDQVVTFYAKAWDFFEKNRPLVYGILAVLVLIVAGLVYWSIASSQQSARAQELLAEVATVYQQGNYEQALQGTGGQPGLIAIADEYGRSPAGNMARFYAADALYQLGQKDRALEYFSAFDKEENFVGASAYAGMAAVYEDRGEYERAGELYQRAAQFYMNEVRSPHYLEQAGRAFQAAGAYEQAREAYQALEQEFPDSQAAQDVGFHLARLAALEEDAS